MSRWSREIGDGRWPPCRDGLRPGDACRPKVHLRWRMVCWPFLIACLALGLIWGATRRPEPERPLPGADIPAAVSRAQNSSVPSHADPRYHGQGRTGGDNR